MPLKCVTCKFGVVGPYSKLYKGRPIGCNYCVDNPEDSSRFGKHCDYVQKEDEIKHE